MSAFRIRRDGLIGTLQQLVRRLLRRPRIPLPPDVKARLERELERIFADDATDFEAPLTLDPLAGVETVRPRLIPPLAVQLAALRQHTLEQAGLADDGDEQRQIDLRLHQWFRSERERAASDGGALEG